MFNKLGLNECLSYFYAVCYNCWNENHDGTTCSLIACFKCMTIQNKLFSQLGIMIHVDKRDWNWSTHSKQFGIYVQ